MKIIDVVQGSPAWHKLRAAHFCASDAPAMMGVGKYQSRNDLLRKLATGDEPEVSSAQQALFDKGHAAEAAARPIAEKIIGDELFPATATDDDDYLLASFDGVTMLEDTIFEHKHINDELRDVDAETLPEHYRVQMDQQLLVSGAEKCLFMASDGTEENCNWFWYYPDESRFKALLAGWKQFAEDLADYQPAERKEEAKAEPIAELPALFIDLDGEVKDTNLTTYKDAVIARVKAINTDLQTDEDFANAEATVKFLDKAEKEIETVKKQALAKTASIDELFRTVDHLREEMRAKRLELNKLVTERKKAIKIEIATAARKRVDEHIATLNEGLGGEYLPQIVTDFNGAMKGKRTVATLQSAADDEIARAKIEASEIAERIRANLATLEKAGFPDLFPDRRQLVVKEADDLQATIKARIAEHEAAEKRRQEADKERQAQQEAERPAAEQKAPEPATAAPTGAMVGYDRGQSEKPRRRPADREIIQVLVNHYQVHPDEVIGWLCEMDMSQSHASNF